MLMRSAAQSLTEQLASRFAERIRNRLLAAGTRLPSVRQCAEQQGVSASTVVAAYDQLLAQGLVEARKNREFFVRDRSTTHIFAAASAIYSVVNGRAQPHFQPQHNPVNATAPIRGMFHGSSDKPQPGMGVFPSDWLETTFMPATVRCFTSTRALQEYSLSYGEPAGDSGLRLALSKKLASINTPAPPEQIITTVRATHALDIASRTLLKTGDYVMVEEPG